MDHLDASVRGAGGSDIELVQNLLFYDVNISNIHCRVTIQMCACVWRGEEREGDGGVWKFDFDRESGRFSSSFFESLLNLLSVISVPYLRHSAHLHGRRRRRWPLSVLPRGKSIKGTSIDGNKRPITGSPVHGSFLLPLPFMAPLSDLQGHMKRPFLGLPPLKNVCLSLWGRKVDPTKSRFEMEWMSLSSCPPNHAAVPDSQTLPMAHYNNSQLSEPLRAEEQQ